VKDVAGMPHIQLEPSRAGARAGAGRRGGCSRGDRRRFGIGSFVIVPLVSEGRCLGFLTSDERGETFSLDAAEVDLMTTFAR